MFPSLINSQFPGSFVLDGHKWQVSSWNAWKWSCTCNETFDNHQLNLSLLCSELRRSCCSIISSRLNGQLNLLSNDRDIQKGHNCGMEPDRHNIKHSSMSLKVHWPIPNSPFIICDGSWGISQKVDMWHFQFSIWLKCSFGGVHFAENPTWIGPVVPKLWASECFSKQ